MEDGRVGTFLRMLTEAKSAGPLPPGETMPTDPAPVGLTLVSAGGVETTMRLSTRALAGRVVAEVPRSGGRGGSQLTLASADLMRVLTQPGPSAWRPSKVFGDFALGVSSITLAGREGDGGGGGGVMEPIVLRRGAGNRWVMDTPVRQDAEQAMVASLIGTLEGLTIARYIDESPVDASTRMGVDDPFLTVTLAGERGTRVLRIGNPADAEGATLFGAIGVGDGDTTFVALEAARLTGLQINARQLVRRTLSTLQEADVSGVRVQIGQRSVTLRRSGQTWTEQVGDAAPVTLGPDRAAGSLAIVQFAVSAGATDVFLRPAPSSPVAGSLELLEPLGNVAQRVEILQLAGDGKTMIVRDGQVERTFATPPGELMRWVRELSGK
jgi:hypothetical protein